MGREGKGREGKGREGCCVDRGKIIVTERDNFLDILRGFAMMYVIFIHCIYWTGLFNGQYSTVIKSFFLIEMPLFFFITGASNSISKQKNVIRFYILRVQRILVPYWIYGLFCILFTLILQIEQEKYFSLGSLPLIFSPISIIPQMTGSLWFVPIYLYVILTFPLLRWYYERHKNENKRYMPLIISAILLCNNGWEILYEAKMVIFYGFWVYMGLFYKEINWEEPLKNKMKVLPTAIFCVLSVIWFVQKNQGYIDMQKNKFPPNIVFLVYTFGALSVLYLFSKYIVSGIELLRKSKIINWIYKQYIQNCYTIFLYHLITFWAIHLAMTLLGIKDYLYKNEYVCCFVYLIITIPINAVIGKMFSWGEKIRFYAPKEASQKL